VKSEIYNLCLTISENKTYIKINPYSKDNNEKMRKSTNYVEISRRLYKGQTIEEIFKRAKRDWKE